MGRFLVLRSLAYRHHLAGLTAGTQSDGWWDRTSTSSATITKSPDAAPGAQRDIDEDLMNVV
jgi:hypothetical protein